jgi:hypothetical protein
MTLEEQILLLQKLSVLCSELDIDFANREVADAALALGLVCDELTFNLKQREVAERELRHV